MATDPDVVVHRVSGAFFGAAVVVAALDRLGEKPNNRFAGWRELGRVGERPLSLTLGRAVPFKAN